PARSPPVPSSSPRAASARLISSAESGIRSPYRQIWRASRGFASQLLSAAGQLFAGADEPPFVGTAASRPLAVATLRVALLECEGGPRLSKRTLARPSAVPTAKHSPVVRQFASHMTRFERASQIWSILAFAARSRQVLSY